MSRKIKLARHLVEVQANHAQTIALADRLLGIPATLVMPHVAPAAKVAATRGYGAEVIVYGRCTEDREAIGRRLAQERGMTLVPPFEHADVIAGQRTATRALLQVVGDVDDPFVCLGGGGLISGAALAARALPARCRIHGVKPDAGNNAQQPLARGKIVHIETPQTIADGAQTQQLGTLTFEIIRRDVNGILTATDAQLALAMCFFAERMEVVVEPTGCLAFAGARHGGINLAGRRDGIIVSKGNIDIARYAKLLAVA